MDRMKKIMGVMFLLAFFVNQSVVYANELDGTAPVITLAQSNPKQLKVGEDLLFEIESTDDLSGTGSVQINYINTGTEGDNGKKIVVPLNQSDPSNNFEEGYTLPNNLSEGKWEADALQVWDVEGNYKVYYRNGFIECSNGYEECPESVQNENLDISELDFIIEYSEDMDTEAPALKSIKLLGGNTAERHAMKTFIVETSDNKSENVRVDINFNDYHSFSFEKNIEENNYQLDLFIMDDLSKLIELSYLTLTDDSGNRSYYSDRPEILERAGITNIKPIGQNLDILVEGYVEDTTKPVLNSFEWEKGTVYTPGTVKMTIDATDDLSDNLNVVGYIYNEGQDYLVSSITFMKNYETGKYEYIRDYPRFSKNESFYFQSFEIKDAQGNTTVYSVNSSESEYRVDKKTINIVNNNHNNIDLFTSTRDNKYIHQIAELEDETVSIVDISSNSLIDKLFFDQLKGQNKTVIFEKLFENSWADLGIQWIINGKDIIQKTKEINADVEINQKYFDKYPGYEFEGYGYDTDDPNSPQNDDDWIEIVKGSGWDFIIETIKEKQILSGRTFIDEFIHEIIPIPYVAIEFPDNGLLPAKSLIRIDATYAFREFLGDDKLNVYYFDEQNASYNIISENLSVTDDRYYEFYITHNSTYVLGSEELFASNNNPEEVDEEIVDNSENNNEQPVEENLENADKKPNKENNEQSTEQDQQTTNQASNRLEGTTNDNTNIESTKEEEADIVDQDEHVKMKEESNMEGKTDGADDGRLPETATETWMIGLIGLMSLAGGVATSISRRKK